MIFAFLLYKMAKENLIKEDGMAGLGIAASIELSIELAILCIVLIK